MMALSEAASITQGNLIGVDGTFTSVTTDSRSIEQGGLFVAITGETNDGHDFVPMAKAQGAIGTVVSTEMSGNFPQIQVEDTTVALGVVG